MPRPHDRHCPHQGSSNLKQSPVISSSYRNRLARVTHTAPTLPPPADFQVAGAITPDATGDYFETGINEGQPYYKHEHLPWFLWYTFLPPNFHDWWITSQLAVQTANRWRKRAGAPAPITGDYTPYGTAIGTATVQLP